MKTLVIRSIQVSLLSEILDSANQFDLGDVYFLDNHKQYENIKKLFPGSTIFLTRKINDFGILNLSFSVFLSLIKERFDYIIVPAKTSNKFGMLNILLLASIFFPKKILFSQYNHFPIVIPKYKIWIPSILSVLFSVFVPVLIPFLLTFLLFSLLYRAVSSPFRVVKSWRAPNMDI